MDMGAVLQCQCDPQYLEVIQSSHTSLTKIKCLCAAVLLQALIDMAQSDQEELFVIQDERWLFDDSDQYLFSFRFICNLLRLNHQTIRASYLSGNLWPLLVEYRKLICKKHSDDFPTTGQQ